ncbi:MAG TPA: ABC transporter substrate-binding protein [Gemmatimonadales bacterium]|nr:ABC transporter substrate-binding protein [Gemmatimonadales bacterium]
MRRSPSLLLAALLACVAPLRAQDAPRRDALVIVSGEEVQLPIPTLTGGSENARVADLLFLRLGRFAGTTDGDRSAVPELARRWTRPDDRTLVFELDPRARWHDGTPVTTRDVLFSFARGRDPKVAPGLARLLREVEAVEADGAGRVTVRFQRAYPEQLYDATYHVHILPAHLLADVPADSIASSAFARNPVGSGPYRWSRRVPGQFTELEAVPDFFLGRPTVPRLVFRYAADHEARLNLVLSGEADIMEDLVPPLANVERLAARPDLRVARFPSFSYGFLWFNQRDPADTTRPHPLLTDPTVRRALVLALDRATITKSILGPYARVPGAPVSSALWVFPFAPSPPPHRPDEARRLLASRGFRDTDGDGILERNGRPLTLSLIVPSSSVARQLAATIVQEQLRRVGVAVEVRSTEFRTYVTAGLAGDFDLNLDQRFQDPSPLGLATSWSCSGSPRGNLARYCNPRVDTLFAEARAGADAKRTWRELLATLADDHAGAFLYARDYVLPLPRRFTKVDLHPESLWRMVWTWSPASR